MLSNYRKSIGLTICLFTGALSSGIATPQFALAQKNQQLPVTLLSPVAMDALVASSAFFPDETVEHILQAAQEPAELHQAAEGRLADAPSASIQYLTNYPDLLRQLDQQLPLTTRLGIAARTQVQDVWAAVDRVRAGFRDTQASGVVQPVTAGSSISYAPMATAYVPRAYGIYAAALWADTAVNELQEEYQQYVNSQATSSGTVTTTGQPVTSIQTTTGPYGGTATTASGQVTQGNTTYSGVAGVGAVTGPNGNTAYGVGGAGASVTNTGSGYEVESAAAGAVVNPATGNYAAGVHSSSGATHQNADGSTSFNRSGSTSIQSSYGSSQVDHQSSGTAGGMGNSSYSGSTDVSSTHGNVSTSTEAGNGQISTTVATDQGSQTFTGGDGAVGSGSQSQSQGQSQNRDRSTARSDSVAPSSRSDSRPFSRESGTARGDASRNSGGSQQVMSQRAGGSAFSRPSAAVQTRSIGSQFSRSQRASSGSSSLSGRSGGSVNRSGRSGSGRSNGGRSGGGRR